MCTFLEVSFLEEGGGGGGWGGGHFLSYFHAETLNTSELKTLDFVNLWFILYCKNNPVIIFRRFY